MLRSVAKILLSAVWLAMICSSCGSTDSNIVPYAPVYIPLENEGLWNTYGVSGVGSYRTFIKPDVPSAAFYTAKMYTGYSGVLLICNSTNEPCAYDLQCPVEVPETARLSINSAIEAECPVCGSRYNVLLGAGGPISGPALNRKYSLKYYRVVPKMMGTSIIGYTIRN